MKYLIFGLGMIPALLALHYLGGIFRSAFGKLKYQDGSTLVVHVGMAAFTSASALWIFSLVVSV